MKESAFYSRQEGGSYFSSINQDKTVSQNKAMEEYRKNRYINYNSWFENEKGNDALKINADENGTIFDFIVAGFPKCGTTTMIANLGHLAPVPALDICTPVSNTVWYAYNNWQKDHNNITNVTELHNMKGSDIPSGHKLLIGSKCPMYIENDYFLNGWSTHLPKTKIIIGIRHPITWFKSFWKMTSENPMTHPELCVGKGCRLSCQRGYLFCIFRARFHLYLARLGKTSLSKEERKWLAYDDPDGGDNLKVFNITNSVFVYAQEDLSESYVWEELAQFLNVDNVPNTDFKGSPGRKKKPLDFCHNDHNAFRSKMMLISYDLAMWMQNYFIPVAKDESRSDVVIPRPDRMMELLESYKLDPCGKLVRLDNGTYIIPPNVTTDDNTKFMTTSNLYNST